jgi:hypothetical protein
VAAFSGTSLSYGFFRAISLTWLVCRPLPNPLGNNDNWKGVPWHESSYGRNCVLLLSIHAAILVADCLLTGVFCFLNADSFNPRVTHATEDKKLKDKSD